MVDEPYGDAGVRFIGANQLDLVDGATRVAYEYQGVKGGLAHRGIENHGSSGFLYDLDVGIEPFSSLETIS